MAYLDALELFLRNISKIYVFRRAMSDASETELSELSRLEKSIDEHYPELRGSDTTQQALYFRRAVDNELQYFGGKDSTIEELRHSIYIHRNKQYQWLLAEAWEEFEKYIQNLYVYAGYVDNTFWRDREIVNLPPNETSNTQLQWFQNEVHRKSIKHADMLKQIRNKLPNIRSIESENGLEINLHLIVTVIEQLRHVIVHNGGQVKSVDQFTAKVLNKAGLQASGANAEIYKESARYFFGTNSFENTIVLLDVPTEPEIPLNTKISLFEKAAGYLIAYAHVIHEEFERKGTT